MYIHAISDIDWVDHSFSCTVVHVYRVGGHQSVSGV